MLDAGASATNKIAPSRGRWPWILNTTRLYPICSDGGMSKVLSGKKGSFLPRGVGEDFTEEKTSELSLKE